MIRTSDRIRDGDTFRVEIRTDPLSGEGGVILSNESDLISSRREMTETSIPRVFNITARPHPRFSLHDLTGSGLKVEKESRAVAVIGIDAVDFGANQLDYNFKTIVQAMEIHLVGSSIQSALIFSMSVETAILI